MNCKKHDWAWLYRGTDETDKAGWFVANALSNKREVREVVCTECGAIGYQRNSRGAGIAVYPNQWREALKAAELAQRLNLQLPNIQ